MKAAAASPPTNPFPGLRPFREDEEHLFFGREHQVDAMVNKLAETHFLAVVGTSGSGKSSLVNCGLRPALRQGLMARAGTAWRMAQFRPGNNPIGALARALAQDGVLFQEQAPTGLTLAEIIETTLRMSKLGLIDIFEQAALDEGVNLLVVADQFEELFRFRQLGSDKLGGAESIGEEAVAFVNLLLEVKERAIDRIFVVLTMRSDFLGDCTQFQGLAEAINAGQYLVPRMTRDERRAAIEGPIEVGGAEIAPVLLTRLVNDVGDNPDQLSILQHALNRTWACWQAEEGGKGPLSLAHYAAIGTMAYALDQHAEQAYAELTTARQQQICEKLFKALTDKATDSRGVRRPSTLAELCSLTNATAAEVTDVIDVFRDPSRSFLMPPAGEVLEMEIVIDISHESLMRVWQRLIKWADEEAESARIYRRLAETADLHAAGKANLLRDPELQLVLDWREKNQPNEPWAARYHPEFAAAMHFLMESSDAREAERAERQRQRAEAEHRAAEQARAEAKAASAKRVRNLWTAVAIMGVLTFVFLVLLLFQYDLRQKALARQADAHQLVAKAEGVFDDNPELGTLLAIEAAQVTFSAGNVLQWVGERMGLVEHEAPITDASANLLQRVVQTPRAELLPNGGKSHIEGEPYIMFFSPDGTRLVTTYRQTIRDPARGARASESQLITKMWNVASDPPTSIDQDERPVSVLAFSPDGQWYAAAVWDGTIGVFEAASDTKVSTVVHSKVVSAVFSPDGQRLGTASADGTAKISEIGSGNELVSLIEQADKIDPLTPTYSPNAKWLAVISSDHTLIVKDTSNGTEAFKSALGKSRATLAFNSKGDRLAAVEPDKITVWEVPSGNFKVLPPGQYDAVTFRPDGVVLAAASSDRRVYMWNVTNMAKVDLETLPYEQSVHHIAFSPSSSRIAMVSDDGTTKIWDVRGRNELISLKGTRGAADKRSAVSMVVFGPDDTQVATASIDGTVRLWYIGGFHTAEVSRIVFSPDGRFLATSDLDSGGTVRIWDAGHRHLLSTVGTGLGNISGIKFNSDNTQLVTATRMGQTTLWDLKDNLTKVQRRFDPVQTDLSEMIVIAWPDRENLVMAGTKGAAGVRNAANLQWIEPYGGPEKASAIELSANGRRLATVSPNRDKLEIWNKDVNKGVMELAWSFSIDKEGKINDIALSPSGQYIASISMSGLIRVWDTISKNSKEPLRSRLPDYFTRSMSRGANHMAFSSERLAIAYANTLVVWDIVKTDVPTFISIKDVTTLAFSPDGKRLATASRDGTVRILLVEPNDLIVRAKHFANRSLSLEECESYQVRRCPKAKLAERQVTGVRRTDDLCGKDVDYTVKPGGGNIRLLGVWTGNWNASHHLCGALIVQQIDQNGTADVIYVYGGSNLSWTKQQQVGRVTGEVLSFNDQEGNTFRFHPGAPGELEANFISQSGRLSGTFQELN